MATDWRKHVGALCAEAAFRDPASSTDLAATERIVASSLPAELRELLRQTDGIKGRYGEGLIWPCARIAADNRLFRENEQFRDLYMPFDPLLFFADAGNGDQFAFPVCGGEVRRPDVFVWDHETDSRNCVAPDLARYLEWSCSGKLKL
jgi:hypothetical protein